MAVSYTRDGCGHTIFPNDCRHAVCVVIMVDKRQQDIGPVDLCGGCAATLKGYMDPRTWPRLGKSK